MYINEDGMENNIFKYPYKQTVFKLIIFALTQLIKRNATDILGG